MTYASRLAPLVLTGAPAVGKSTAARKLADSTPRCACIDVDDVRQLIRNGGAAPWQGTEGRRQQRLGAENACRLTAAFTEAGFATTISDVVDTETLHIYRERLGKVVILHLDATFAEVKRRAATRPVHLTDDEFATLHAQQSRLTGCDERLDITNLDVPTMVEVVRSVWLAHAV